MKFKTWALWLFSTICFTFVGIMDLIEKKYFLGTVFILLGVVYIFLSIKNYKGSTKSNEKVLSEIELRNMDNELRSLIAEGKKIEAIKKYRMITGLGLKEAKEYVDLLGNKN